MRTKLLLTLLASLPLLLWAQPKTEYGFLGGVTNHLSDTQGQETFPKGTTQALGVSMRHYLDPSLAMKFSYINTTLSGDETRMGVDWRNQRAFRYESQIHEIAATFEVDLRGKRRFSKGKFHHLISPYFYAGGSLSVINFNTDYNLKGEQNPVTPQSTIQKDIDERSTIALGVPVGAGLRFDISKSLVFNVEARAIPTTSDYLDGISEAGNPNRRDAYGMLLMELNYRIISKRYKMRIDDDGFAYVPAPYEKEIKSKNLTKKAIPAPIISDYDKDGVADDDDACPNEAGSRFQKGCPDRDEDGVLDVDDNCPDEYGTTSGCPDEDKDGILDRDDLCPTVAGTKRFVGCPDSDDDGFADSEDLCPTMAGTEEDGGCPAKDTDGDGVVDRNDGCPNEPGLREDKGCPAKDTDGDGVMDRFDLCPNSKGLKHFNGCPDTDGDGLEDSRDACPSVAGSNHGCPTREEIAKARIEKKPAITNAKAAEKAVVVTKNTAVNSTTNVVSKANITSGSITNTTIADVNPVTTPTVTPKSYDDLNNLVQKSAKKVKFNTNSDILIKTSFGELNKISTIMRANPKYGIVISGHTDNVGNDAKNQVLSEKRAKRCFDYLYNKGVPKSRMQYNGYGENMPIRSNDSPTGRNENRRVEFQLQEN